MERVLVNTPVTLSEQWTEDGVAADPSTVTVGITRGDGTALVAPGAATTVPSGATGPRQYTLQTSQTTQLNRLKVTWTSTTKGSLTTIVEIVGGYIFSIAEAKATSELSTLTTAQIGDLRTSIEQAIEKYCGVAFVPRYERELLTASSRFDALLKWPQIRTIRTASLDGDPLDVADLTPTPVGVYSSDTFLTMGGTWRSRYNLLVEYEHGYDEAPGDITASALRWARQAPAAPVVAGQVIRSEAGEEAIQYAAPSTTAVGRSPLPDVQSTLDAYRFVPVA